MTRTRIIGTGSALPERVLTNKDVEKICDTSDEWIRKRTGIHQRYAAEEGVGVSDLSTSAARMALENAGTTPKDLDAIVCCTLTPDQIAPSSAILVQDKLGAGNCAAFDLNAACSGFLYGLATARGLIDSGMYRTILLVGSETATRLIDWQFRDTAVLFGDGAGAVVLQADEGDCGVLAMHLGADGSAAHILRVMGGGYRYKPTPEYLAEHPMHIEMNGPELFKRAVLKFEEAANEVLGQAGLAGGDVDLFVPHQANGRIIEAARKRLGVDESKVVLNLDKVGNTVAASIPLALHQANEDGRVKPGDTVLLAAFGAGLTWGSAVLRW